MKVLILAGGLGSRLSELTLNTPKPMVEIGGIPILVHLMKIFSDQGYKDFVIALGYKGVVIKKYFANYNLLSSDFSIDLSTGKVSQIGENKNDWKITLVDTGAGAMTGGRVASVIDKLGLLEPFFLTYGDGLADVNLEALLSTHKRTNALATITAVRPVARFGEISIGSDQLITSFKEKPQVSDGWINGGFMVINPKIRKYISCEQTVLEHEPLSTVCEMGRLAAYEHKGFWQCMDTKRDVDFLNALSTEYPTPWDCGNT